MIQNDKIVNRLNRDKDSFRIADNDFNSSITDALPMTQKFPSFLSTPGFSASRDQIHSNQIIQTDVHGAKIKRIIRD